MAATSYRYLVNLPGVCQGKTIVEGTRIGVHDVVGLILNGASVDDVCRSFPDLSRAQVYECLAYYEDHRTQIDALVAEQSTVLPVTASDEEVFGHACSLGTDPHQLQPQSLSEACSSDRDHPAA